MCKSCCWCKTGLSSIPSPVNGGGSKGQPPPNPQHSSSTTHQLAVLPSLVSCFLVALLNLVEINYISSLVGCQCGCQNDWFCLQKWMQNNEDNRRFPAVEGMKSRLIQGSPCKVTSPFHYMDLLSCLNQIFKHAVVESFTRDHSSTLPFYCTGIWFSACLSHDGSSFALWTGFWKIQA